MLMSSEEPRRDNCTRRWHCNDDVFNAGFSENDTYDRFR